MSFGPVVHTVSVPQCRFRDRRLNQRAEHMFRALATHPTANLKQLATTRAEQAAYSRLLNNDDTHLDHFIFGIVQDTYRQIRAQACPQLLILNDTTEVNLQAQVGYHQRHGLGVAGNNSDAGFFLHASLAFDPTAKVLIGCAALRVWTRKGGSEDRTDGEARKWFEVGEQLHQAKLSPELTFVQDREGDIFALWQTVRQSPHQLLTRAKQDRRIAMTRQSPQGKLFADLAAQPVGGQYELRITSDRQTNRTARTSVMETRWLSVLLLEPAVRRPKAQQVRVQAIEVRECAASVPVGQTPLVWILLTTHAVDCFQDALQMVQWYLYRWQIEDCFAALKTRGLDLEQSRLHHGQALMKLAVMTFWSATRLTALVKGREDEITNARAFFTAPELACMDALCPALEGQTRHQRNTYAPHSLAWAVWILARLGRGHGIGPPGIQTIRAGLHTFEAVFLGWNIKQQI